MDKFAWGSIIVAAIVEVFVVWGWFLSPQDGFTAQKKYSSLIWGSMLPVVLVLVTLLFYRLQKTE